MRTDGQTDMKLIVAFLTFTKAPKTHHRISIFHVKKGIRGKGKTVPITGLEWPRGFQEVKVPRFRDNGTG